MARSALREKRIGALVADPQHLAIEYLDIIFATLVMGLATLLAFAAPSLFEELRPELAAVGHGLRFLALGVIGTLAVIVPIGNFIVARRASLLTAAIRRLRRQRGL